MQWLHKFDKTLPNPLILTTPSAEFSGAYYHPTSERIIIDGKEYDAKNGIILISEECEDITESILAHEWRHHQQHHSGVVFTDWPWEYTDNYEEAIIQYFKKNYELDALYFEFRHAPNETNSYWMSLINRYYTTRSYHALGQTSI